MKQPTYPEGWDAERVLAYGLWQFTHRSARALYERKDFLDERFILPDRCLVDVQIWNRVKILEADRGRRLVQPSPRRRLWGNSSRALELTATQSLCERAEIPREHFGL